MSNLYFRLPAENLTAGGITLKFIMKSFGGDMPNISFKTLGGSLWWDTFVRIGEYRIQQNLVTGHARILDDDDVRVAWGSISAMKQKLSRLADKDFIRPGDILGIKRPAGYEHYAVYIGEDRVIHFAADNSDFGKAYVHEAPMDEFLNGQDRFFVLEFGSGKGRPNKLWTSTTNGIISPPSGLDLPDLTSYNFNVYSPEETIERAKSVIGANEHNFRTKYNLILNNCEHFVIWCKTGQKRSLQIEDFFEKLLSAAEMTYYYRGTIY